MNTWTDGLNNRQVSTSGETGALKRDTFAWHVEEAIRRTHLYYRKSQHSDGYWWFELESNVTITAEYLMLLHFAGLVDRERDAKIATYLLKRQRPDGTWAIHHGGKGDLSTTVEAYFALKLAEMPERDERLTRARSFIAEAGGLAGCRVFTKIFLALFGQYPWDGIPSVPVEIMLLPPWFPLNIYNFSSWARATFVPLSIVLDAKPTITVGPEQGVPELRLPSMDRNTTWSTNGTRFFSWKGVFSVLDNFVKATEQSRLRSLRRKGREEALRWILGHQEETGDWGGIQPAMVNSILALLISGYNASHEVVRKGLDALERFSIDGESELGLQSCISPVWDTALTALALRRSGLPAEDRMIAKAGEWLAGKQILAKGDWSIKKPLLEPGGWAFEFTNNWYPDIDDTAVVLMLLKDPACKRFAEPEKLDRAVRWVQGMQGKDGGWGAFDVDNNIEAFNRLPFGDLEAMIDPSTADITGRVLELYGNIGYGRSGKGVSAALDFVRRTQEADGLWWGRWGVNYCYGTWSVLAGLRSIGEDMTQPYIRKAVSALKEHQNPDGGWGECCESYKERDLRLQGNSTPSQTAWVVMALLLAGAKDSLETKKGVEFLLERQQEDGTWDEEEFTATGFPKHFMIRYHNYRNCFPLMALGLYAREG